jgi:hypothetical protein
MGSLPVSHKLIEQIDFERDQLRQLLAESRELIDNSSRKHPAAAESWALGAILHAFYNGIENILKRVAATYDGKPDDTGKWHIDLLNKMAAPNAKRSRVISPELLTLLKKYLAFRHLFRSIYTHELRWESMEELVRRLDESLKMFDDEIDTFCKMIEE